MTQENRKYEVILGAENVMSRVRVTVSAGSRDDAIVRAAQEVVNRPALYPMDRGAGDWKVVTVNEVKPTLKELQEAMLDAGAEVHRMRGTRLGEQRGNTEVLMAFQAWLRKLREA